MMERKKINWILILQGWTMLWVVLGHSPLNMDESMPQFAKIIFHIAYSFHMPLFILISGYLFYLTRLYTRTEQLEEGKNRWSYKAIIIDKLKRLGIPFIVFTLIAMAMKVMFPDDMARSTSFSIGEIVHAIIYPREGPLLEMWFVAVIMWMFVLTPVWEWSFKSGLRTILVLIILLSLNLWTKYLPIGSFLCLRDTAKFGIYFYLGMLACKYGTDNVFKAYRYRILLIAAMCYVVCMVINFELGTALCGIAFSVCLAFVLDQHAPKSFSSFRSYTYQIFLIGIFAQILIKMIYKRVSFMDIAIANPMLIYVAFFLVCLVMGLYIPIIVSKIAEKTNWNPVLLSLGLKKK